jgi:hypothetical protein
MSMGGLMGKKIGGGMGEGEQHFKAFAGTARAHQQPYPSVWSALFLTLRCIYPDLDGRHMLLDCLVAAVVCSSSSSMM